MTDIILKAEHLKKVFVSGKKSMTAVDDVSFELNRGECLGIVENPDPERVRSLK